LAGLITAAAIIKITRSIDTRTAALCQAGAAGIDTGGELAKLDCCAFLSARPAVIGIGYQVGFAAVGDQIVTVGLVVGTPGAIAGRHVLVVGHAETAR